MDILHRRGQATAAEVQADLPDSPGYSTVRKLLEILETKGWVTHASEGARYVYQPVVAKTEASRSALERVVETFFDGSPEDAVVALLGLSDRRIDRATLERLAREAERLRRSGQ